MLESPFTFPDGDHYPIYLSETPGGGVKLSDRGHTLMHVSYERDVDFFHGGARASLRGQIIREREIDDEEGIFSIEVPPDQVATALFRFGQVLTRIHDLTFPSRNPVSSAFYEDLRGLLFTMLDEETVNTDYISPDVPNGNDYPVNYHFARSDGRSVFLYGVPDRDKARLTTIMLSHLLLHGLKFDSLIVFADQREIPRLVTPGSPTSPERRSPALMRRRTFV